MAHRRAASSCGRAVGAHPSTLHIRNFPPHGLQDLPCVTVSWRMCRSLSSSALLRSPSWRIHTVEFTMRTPEICKMSSQIKRIRKAIFPVAGRGPASRDHQGDAQGDAHRRRPAGDPARGGRGPGRRYRALHLRDRPQQGRDRGPSSSTASSSSVRCRNAARRRSWPAALRAAATRPDELHAPAEAAGAGPRRVVRTRDRGQRAVRAVAPRHAASRAPALPRGRDRGLQPERRQPYRRGTRAGGRDPALRHRRRRGPCGQGLAHHQHDREAKAGTAPSNLHITGRYILQPEIFGDSSSAVSAAPAARSSSPTP